MIITRKCTFLNFVVFTAVKKTVLELRKGYFFLDGAFPFHFGFTLSIRSCYQALILLILGKKSSTTAYGLTHHGGGRSPIQTQKVLPFIRVTFHN